MILIIVLVWSLEHLYQILFSFTDHQRLHRHIIGGSVMFGTVIGRVFLAEILSPRGWFGVVLIATGITLVGMESE